MGSETAIQKRDNGAILEQVVVGGDLSKLSAAERVGYYRQVCDSLSINPYTRPFQYITLNGRLTLYASRDCTDQLRKRDRVSVTIVNRELRDDIYIVSARAVLPDGRTDESIGAVAVGGLKGTDLANALMKCETKAKRRATLSIVGLGWLDETEVDTIANAQPSAVQDIPSEELNATSVEWTKAHPVIGVETPTANPTPAERPSQALLTRWQTYWQQAQEAGVEADDLVLLPDTTASEAVRRLNALVQRIADSKKLKATSGTS